MSAASRTSGSRDARRIEEGVMNGSPDGPGSGHVPVDMGHLQMQRLLRHVPAHDIPPSQDLFSAAELEDCLEALRELPFSLIAVGDTPLGDRPARTLARQGPDYACDAVRPLLCRASMDI